MPGGSSVRAGAYLAEDVVIMPPAFVNVGAYVDRGAMIASHAARHFGAESMPKAPIIIWTPGRQPGVSTSLTSSKGTTGSLKC